MNEARKAELTKIKEEKRIEIENIQNQINQWNKERQNLIDEYDKVEESQRKLRSLNRLLRIAIDAHNRAVWCIEELVRLENPSVNADKELIETKESRDE